MWHFVNRKSTKCRVTYIANRRCYIIESLDDFSSIEQADGKSGNAFNHLANAPLNNALMTSSRGRETVMVRAIVIAALISSATVSLAEPPKSPAKRPQQKRSLQVVLASAEAPRATAHDEAQQPSQSEPKRRIAPRITHCRCGDPQPGDATPEE
jgi:hypothetical protein